MESQSIGLWWNIIVGTSLFLALVTAFVVVIIYHGKTKIRLEQEKRAAVQKTERRYKDLFDNILDIVYVHDPDGVILEINDTVSAALGYAPGELKGKNIAAFIQPRYGRKLPAYREQTVVNRTETIGILPLLSKSRDRVIMIEYKSSPVIDSGAVIAVRGIARDVTERLRHERQLERSQAKIASLLVRAESIQEKLAQLSRTTIRMQEEDRKWISHELHDEIGQILASILMNLEILKKEVGREGGGIAVIGELKEITNEVLRKIRMFLQTIRPVPINDGGLAKGIRTLAADFSSRSGIQVTYDDRGDVDLLDADQKVSLYRIVQESLTNIYKHAEATSVRIAVKQNDNNLVVEISDNGKGFDARRPEKSTGLGHVGMQERAILARGRLDVESSPGAGTTIRISMPR
jgi:PAS domain S-box-containing protein